MACASSPLARAARIFSTSARADSALNSTANLEEKGGKTLTVGNSTEGALLQYLREGHVD